uniref:Protein kinase domain-containing protein n=1 Tax=Ascaris lumbricoides TaxID=6252 RepID=A0A0M3HQT6_ASCLU
MSRSVDRTILDSLIAGPSSTQKCTEQQVQVFMKQLLSALKFMHDKKIAHLDLRPEAILLQDDHLCLADFGQSRRLVRGKVAANILGSPEFVSPEIAAGVPVTLASDMWSVGTLTYVLLSGISPFLGDNDTETIRNVMHAKYSLDVSELSPITDEAKDFIAKLLVLDPRKRLTVDEALNHRWLAVPFLGEAKLASDCLREFKYRHKWLERRVFVQQTPSEQLISPVQGPDVRVASALQRPAQGLARSEPCNIYDYLRIKDRITQPLDDTQSHTQRLPASVAGRDRGRLLTQDRVDSLPRSDYQKSAMRPAEVGDEQMPPLRLVRGEHRDIEEEIANRILSDISEENSVASADDVELATRSTKEPRRSRQRKSRSRSSTPNAEGYSQETTPLLSPALTIESVEATSQQQFFPDTAELLRHPAQLDPKIPPGAPLFLEGLSRPHPLVLEGQGSPHQSTHSLSPSSLRSMPGTKSPVSLSPSKEYSMEVIIATKMGIPQVAKPHFETAQEIGPQLASASADKQRARPLVHEEDFNNLMNQIESMKERRRKEREDMEKYRPKNFYKEDIEFERPKMDEDEFPWESNYQIGPETFLLATRGAAFNARVRDYRRELWGDGAPFVTQGILGFRNQDISVRERRRFTDLIREDPEIAKSVENLDRDTKGSRSGAIRRIQSDISKLEPKPTRKDGTFGAIFKRRLKDVAFMEDAKAAVFECEVIGNPRPSVVWFHHESALTSNSKYNITSDGNIHRLRIEQLSMVDVGEYSCTAENEHGTDRTSARLMAGDTPGRTGRPEIELSSDTEVFITWEAPSMSSCLEGYTYKLEMRPAGENDHFSEWRLVSDQIDEEAVVVRHLTPLGIYQFRVIAKNAFGWGAPSLTSRIIRTHPKGKYPKGSPKLQIDILKQQYHLCVLSKPAKPQFPAQSLREITEEDEEETPSEIMQTTIPTLALNDTDDPEKRFKLGSELYHGRFSLILNAVDSKAEVGQNCAVKVFPVSSDAPEIVREFDTLKECQHENALHLIAAYRKSNFMYLFTEKLHEDIFERFTYNDYYNEEQISRSIAQIAAALHWIHFKGFAHLNVQPSNVMFVSRRSWQLKLIDFGDAQAVGPEAKAPSPVNVHWAAPELHQTEQPITVQSDIWGLGIITFCLLSGFHPFTSEGDTESEVKENVLHEKCNPNLIFVQATQESLRFVTWALKKNPMRRMRTDEALTHRWLSNDSSMVRRRETIKYPSSRLRKTASVTAAPNTTLAPAFASFVRES